MAIVRAGHDGLVSGERVGVRVDHVEQEMVPTIAPVFQRIEYSA